MDFDSDYRILDPSSNFCGKSYSEWTSDWFNWFVSINADKRNSGPVVFLRSHGLPNTSIGAFVTNTLRGVNLDTSTALSSVSNTDSNYPTEYVNDPNIRVGGDRLQIFSEQAVFIPIITAHVTKDAPYRDYGNLLDSAGLLIDNGDNPPDACQLTINTLDINLEKCKHGITMSNFRICTPIFTGVIPDAPYGTSVKDFLEEGPIPPGDYPTLVDGYFVMIQFLPKKASETYYVHSWASAGREVRGPYFSELLYEIQVNKRNSDDIKQQNLGPTRGGPHGRITTRFPARNEAILDRVLSKKKEFGELNDLDVKAIRSISNKAKVKNGLV
jgi:hypothetical protein